MTAGMRLKNVGRGPSRGRKRHWVRWILAGGAALILLLVLAVVGFVALAPTPAPLALPKGAVTRPAGPLDGTWNAGTGSVAGFRIQESALGMSNYVAGTTSAVSGTVEIRGSQVTAATFRVDLTAIRVNGKRQPQFARTLDILAYPMATLTLTRPFTLSPAFATGTTSTATAAAIFTMNGRTRQVTATFSARRDGTELQVAGRIPVSFSAWQIITPSGYGPLGSLASQGAAEFLLILHRK